MRYCELCNYFYPMGQNGQTGECEFAGVIFPNAAALAEGPYPCACISMAAYEAKRLAPLGTRRLLAGEWRCVYMQRHHRPASAFVPLAG